MSARGALVACAASHLNGPRWDGGIMLFAAQGDKAKNDRGEDSERGVKGKEHADLTLLSSLPMDAGVAAVQVIVRVREGERE